MVVNGDDRAVSLQGCWLQRLPAITENNPLVVNLPIFLAELLVSVGNQVNAFPERVLIFRAAAYDVRGMVDTDFPLRERGGGAVVHRILLRHDHLDILRLARDGRKVR